MKQVIEMRRIANFLAGRNKVVEYRTTPDSATEFLEELDKYSIVIDGKMGGIKFHKNAHHKSEAAHFLIDNFPEQDTFESDYCVDVIYSKYSGKNDERHYIDLSLGRIGTRIGSSRVAVSVFNRATITCTIKRDSK